MSNTTVKITKERYDSVLRYGVCPHCGNYTIVNVFKRSKKDALDRGSRFLGAYHARGDPEGHLCWNMSKFDPNKPEKSLYEKYGGAGEEDEAKKTQDEKTA